MSVNEGEVEVTLAGGKTIVLRSTLRAAKTVDAKLGGFQETFRRLAGFHFDSYCIIVGAGIGKSPAEVEEAVFQTGLGNLIGPLTDYVTLLMNGGRPVGKEAGDEKGEG
jgi:hypothetical protein